MADKKFLNEIVIDDGSIEIPVKNKHGKELGRFYFIPTDLDIVNRYNDFVEHFGEIMDPLTDISINSAGEVDVDEDTEMDAEVERDIESLNSTTARLKEAINKLFNSDDAADALFAHCNPFSPVNGAFFCEEAISGIGKCIEANFEKELKESKKRIEKYTHGVKTGKHKDGRK